MIIYDPNKQSFFESKFSLRHGFTKLTPNLSVNTVFYAPVQVHGSKIKIIKQNNNERQWLFVPEVDGLLYQSLNPQPVCLYVRTADCLPILLASKKNRLIGAVHMGWQGAYQDILGYLRERLEELKVNPADVKIIFGPAINGGCYNISMQRYKLLQKQFSDSTRSLFKAQNKYYFSLLSFACWRLVNLGFKQGNFSWRLFCTHCQNKDFYSYRLGSRHQSLISYICNYE